MRVYYLNKVENMLAKGEITHYERYHLLSQCFQKSSPFKASEYVYEGNGTCASKYRYMTFDNMLDMYYTNVLLCAAQLTYR